MRSVAIIDDGVEFSTGLKIVKSIEIDEDLNIKELNKSCDLESIHGNTCALILDKYYKNVNFFSVNVLTHRLHCTKKQLIKGIEWCIENNINVINMSLGTIDYRDFKEIKEVIDKAYHKGIIIVAACNNKNVFTYPASNEKVIGVKCEVTFKEGEYEFNLYPLDGIEITACGIHKLDNVERKTRLCNSYATPMITAKVCDIVDKHPGISLKKIKEKLYEDAINYRKDEAIVNYIDLVNNPSLIEKFYDVNYKRKKIDVPILVVVSDEKTNLQKVLENFYYNFRKDGYYAVVPGIKSIPLGKVKDAVTLKRKLENIYAVYDCDILILGIEKRMDILKEIKELIVPDMFIFIEENEGLNKEEIETYNSPIINLKNNNLNESYKDLLEILLKE